MRAFLVASSTSAGPHITPSDAVPATIAHQLPQLHWQSSRRIATT
jgi:hypothetical protein